MNKTLNNKSTARAVGVSSSSSIIARAGQIMALFITIGVIGMISSMLVTESLSGDASQINRAGALRMQAIRVSRALSIDSLESESVASEFRNFDQRITQLFQGGVSNALNDENVRNQYSLIVNRWQALKAENANRSIQAFDGFVLEIDKLVTLLQQASENKLSLLRLIQGVSLLTLMIIAFVVLNRLNRTIVIPLKQLVKAAEHAAKGDFSIKVSHQSNDELGLLAKTINHMSDELALTYQDFELMVDSKTKALTRSNRSFQVLYRAASSLATQDYQTTDAQIINELEEALGQGKISIEYSSILNNNLAATTKEPKVAEQMNDLEQIIFPLATKHLHYGSIRWRLPKQYKPREWQTLMLQAMADILATVVDLTQQRNTEKRLIIFEERAVIARELHDSLAQSLSYLKVQISLLTRKIQKNLDRKTIDETIEDIKQGINDAYRQLRELLTTFRLKLDDPSLANALHGTVVEFSEKCQHSIELEFELTENSLTANQEIHVLQIIREALSNIHRHAKAKSAGVVLKLKNDKLQIEIWDDGIGIKSLVQEQGHFGLGIMKERAKSLNTDIQIIARIPKGTRVLFEF